MQPKAVAHTVGNSRLECQFAALFARAKSENVRKRGVGSSQWRAGDAHGESGALSPADLRFHDLFRAPSERSTSHFIDSRPPLGPRP